MVFRYSIASATLHFYVIPGFLEFRRTFAKLETRRKETLMKQGKMWL